MKDSFWLPDINKWPDQPRIPANIGSEREAKIIKKILATTTEKDNVYDTLLNKDKLHKISRTAAWIGRFIDQIES